MVYVPPEYPATIPDYNEVWPYVDDVDDVEVAAWDAMVKEIRAIMTELGTIPKGAKTDVRTRLDDVDTAVGTNTTHRGSDGKDHSDVVANTTHRGSDGKDHSDVVANTAAVALNTTHRGSDGKDHSDVVANTANLGFHDRGDPAAWDKQVGDFTTDAAWREMDLSATGLPADANAVLIRLYLQDDAVASYINFRRDDNANTVNISSCWTQVANILIQTDIIVPCKLSKIEYQGKAVAFTAINIAVKGWWL